MTTEELITMPFGDTIRIVAKFAAAFLIVWLFVAASIAVVAGTFVGALALLASIT
jgi:hypothetical protein